MKFTIDYDNQPIKFLKQQDKHIVGRILNKIEDTLSENPVPQNAKRVEGKKDLVFRIRIGDHRVLYRISYQTKSIIIIKIDKRPRAYKK